MPLIIVTGTPCSGKTFRTQQILQEFESRIAQSSNESKRAVIQLPSHHASLDPLPDSAESYHPPDQDTNPRDVIYNLARHEKTARAEEFSTIKRALNKNVVVIADAPNYIKGFRYQLFCEAKAAGTRSVVLHCAAREDESEEWNNARLTAWDWQVEVDQNTNGRTGATQPSRSNPGGNTLGDLDPESHTAIYGDKVINEDTRSQTSSTGAAISDDEGNESSARARHRQADDTMTLKSLYITDRHVSTTTAPTQTQREILQDIQEIPQPTQPWTLPSATPPPPRSSLPYSPSTLKSLHMRYEPPSPFTRWDTPLFTIPTSDPHPPYDQIWHALFPGPPQSTSKKALAKQQQQQQQQQQQAKSQPLSHPLQPPVPASNTLETPTPRQNAATILPTATPPNALQTLESTTSEISRLILSAARTNNIADGQGGTITISISLLPDTTQPLEIELEVPEGLMLSQPVLQRARRKFTQIQRGGIAHGMGYAVGRRGVAEGFVRFLEGEWEVSS